MSTLGQMSDPTLAWKKVTFKKKDDDDDESILL